MADDIDERQETQRLIEIADRERQTELEAGSELAVLADVSGSVPPATDETGEATAPVEPANEEITA